MMLNQRRLPPTNSSAQQIIETWRCPNCNEQNLSGYTNGDFTLTCTNACKRCGTSQDYARGVPMLPALVERLVDRQLSPWNESRSELAQSAGRNALFPSGFRQEEHWPPATHYGDYSAADRGAAYERRYDAYASGPGFRQGSSPGFHQGAGPGFHSGSGIPGSGSQGSGSGFRGNDGLQRDSGFDQRANWESRDLRGASDQRGREQRVDWPSRFYATARPPPTQEERCHGYEDRARSPLRRRPEEPSPWQPDDRRATAPWQPENRRAAASPPPALQRAENGITTAKYRERHGAATQQALRDFSFRAERTQERSVVGEAHRPRSDEGGRARGASAVDTLTNGKTLRAEELARRRNGIGIGSSSEAPRRSVPEDIEDRSPLVRGQQTIRLSGGPGGRDDHVTSPPPHNLTVYEAAAYYRRGDVKMEEQYKDRY